MAGANRVLDKDRKANQRFTEPSKPFLNCALHLKPVPKSTTVGLYLAVPMTNE